jgi:hypothetical protein
MKKKSNIVEMDGTSMGSSSTSSTTSSSTPSTSTSTSGKGSITVSTSALKKPEVVAALDKLKKSKVPIQVVEENVETSESKMLEYLSEVKDSESGEISQPFTIGDKKYQMVRAITPKKEKVMGVYSFNEVDEKGNNKIYSVQEFEDTIAKKAITETGVVEPEGPETATLNPIEEKKENPSFAGYKHFIVNQKTGKARKFKTIEELAKAQMGEGEKYMGVREFKKFVDESLFGSGKRQSMTEVDDVSGNESDEEMNIKAKKLMSLISKRIPETVIKTIKTPIAQREVIAAFAEMIGVPRNGLAKLITGLKDIAKGGTNKPQPIDKGAEPTPAATEKPVAEGRIIKTIKVKDIK